MARYTEAKCRICRREGTKVFLKGDRCYTDKCPFERRPYPPGQHGRRRKKSTDYEIQLREKQKVRRMYGLLEGQFHAYFQEAERKKGVTGQNLLGMLELRLDNVVYRAGFANSRSQARQLVRHGHFQLNGHKVDIPSHQLGIGDIIQVKERSKKVPVIQEAIEVVDRRGIPEWLENNTEQYSATVKTEPQREHITFPVNEHLIVELYSK
ncbi:MAG: 30S ribosomal protein S4 [Desulfovermiculus sp.]|nr:30S ribosomal protein S4 [Desulfovermiculus sp.]